ncbi:hypothetical protein SAMN04487949_2833 [Halogranum gelatinilyticum]|uniref:Uncharacterized protein n=1 Tax=Halogranum gelatinilyticum TaxID=660521 RepID=A0A1G9X5A0_9EURY|nr:DUF6516 family protein [Halogranum gelatinilyticum]SDM91545.1 hypothetical protein SAMN04487949_2833 [Halogranum gelatinilyticum]
MSDDGKTLNEALLRAVARRLGSLTLVDSVSVFPRTKPESVVATLDTVYYPDTVETAVLEVRAYVNDDFHVTYREDWGGDEWMCRWDRHDNPHNERDHFHHPPAARTTDATDRDYPTELTSLLKHVLSEVDTRIGAVWETA